MLACSETVLVSGKMCSSGIFVGIALKMTLSIRKTTFRGVSVGRAIRASKVRLKNTARVGRMLRFVQFSMADFGFTGSN
jgi:hypothetical protein